MKLIANISQKMGLETKVHRDGRLRIIWDVELIIGTHIERFHYSAFYDPLYYSEKKYDYVEIFSERNDTYYRTLDIMSVLRDEIESLGINPDAVNYKFVELESEFPNFEEV